MEQSIVQPALAGAFRRSRDRFNAAFFMARQASPGLDEALFSRHLCECLPPAVDAVARHSPDRVDDVVAALYELSLSLLCKGVLGDSTGSGVMLRFWHELLPELHVRLAEQPVFMAGALANAVLNLAFTPGARPGEWLRQMPRLSSLAADFAEFLDAGRVLAWRCGMAHMRELALEAARRLNEPCARIALGIDSNIIYDMTPCLRALAADPWLRPDQAAHPVPAGRPEVRKVAEVGGFRGFGGPFLTPPHGAIIDGVIHLYDAECVWRLDADLFGSVFRRAQLLPDEMKSSFKTTGQGMKRVLCDVLHGVVVSGDGSVAWGKAAGSFHELEEASSVACDGTTVAVTRTRSHKVILLAHLPLGSGAGPDCRAVP